MNEVIRIENLTKEYKVGNRWPGRELRAITALKEVNLQVHPGDVVALLGPNGAGKSTLIRILCGLVLPSAGKAYIAGYDVVKERKSALHRLSLCGDSERSFYYRISGRHNLEFFAALYNVPPRKKKQRIEKLLQELDLKEAT